MKVEIEKSEIRKILPSLKIVLGEITKPHVKVVRINVQDHKAKFTARAFEIQLECIAGCIVADCGQVEISFDDLTAATKGSGKLTIFSNANEVSLIENDGELNVGQFEMRDDKIAKIFDAGKIFEDDNMPKVLESLRDCACKPYSTKKALENVEFREFGGSIRIAATDGFRLAMLESGVEAEKDFSVIFPRIAFEIAASINGDSNNFAIHESSKRDDVSNRYVMMSGNDWNFVCRRPDVYYPNVMPLLIQSGNTIEFKTTTQELIKSSAYILKHCIDKHNTMKLKHIPGLGNGLSIEGEPTHSGAVPKSKIKTSNEPEGLKAVWFNAKMIEGMAKNFPSEDVRISTSPVGNNPVLFKAGRFTALVMPLVQH